MSSKTDSSRSKRRGRKYARGKRGKKGKKKRPGEQSFAAFLSSTLIPVGKAKAHMAAKAQAFKDREKLDPEHFESTKHDIFCLNALLFAIGLAAFGMSGYMVFELQDNSLITLMVCLISAIVLVVSLLGIIGAKLESDRLLLSYMSLTTFMLLLTLFVGSFTMVLTERAVAYVERSIDQSVCGIPGANACTSNAGVNAASSGKLRGDQVRIFLYCLGGVALLMAPIQARLLYKTGMLITTMRAISNLMETLTIMLFPIGCFMIAGGVWLIDNMAVGTTAITALFVFALGCIVIMLSVLGYFGTMIHSRGMLLVFQWPVLLLTIAMIGFGVWAFAMADDVQSQLDKYWEDIRQFLPLTFEGRYDRVMFREFIESNLLIMAFASIYTGGFFLFCAFSAGLMRHEIKVEQFTLRKLEDNEAYAMEKMEFEAERQAEIKQLEEEAHMSHAEAEHLAEEHYRHKLAHGDEWIKRHRNAIHKKWKEAWTKGSKSSRRAVRIACATVCVVVVVVIACGVTFLVYASFCEQLQSTCHTSVHGFDIVPGQAIVLDSGYTRGELTVAAAGSESLSEQTREATVGSTKLGIGFRSCAINPDFTQGALTQLAGTNQFGIHPKSGAPTYLGVDTSCQQQNVELAVPSIHPYSHRVNISSESKVKLTDSDLVLSEFYTSGKGLTLEVENLNISYTQRSDDPLHQAVVGSSDLGEIKIKGTCAHLDNALVSSHNANRGGAGCTNVMQCPLTSNAIWPVPSASFDSINGFLSISGFETQNCDLKLESRDSAPIFLNSIVSKCYTQSCQFDSLISVLSNKGSVELTNVIGDAISVASDKGRINITDVKQLNYGSFLRATSNSGGINLGRVTARGNVNVETDTGGIRVDIAPGGFSGRFIISHAKDKSPSIQFAPGSVVIESTGDYTTEGTIVCHKTSSCAYQNELIITSKSGQVELVVSA